MPVIDKKTSSSPQERLLQVVRALLNGKRLDRYQAAAMFDVNHAAAYRLLKLTARYVPGVSILPGTRPEKFGLTAPPTDEPSSISPALAAAFAAGYSRIFRGTVIERELREIRERTIARLSKTKQGKFDDIDRKVVVLSPEEEILDGHDGTLISIVEALLDQLEVKINYEHFGGGVEKLTIRPYSLVAVQSRLYVVAPRDGSPYPFRFQRIRRAQVTATSFVYPTVRQYDPPRLFESSMGIWLNQPEPTLITIRLSSTWASYAKYHQWHPSQKRRSLPNGGVEVDLFVRPCPEFQAWLLGFGSDAEVIAPSSVRDAIAARVVAAARLYSTT